MSKSILKLGESYTFRKYYELPFDAEDILAELEFSLRREEIDMAAFFRLDQDLSKIDVTTLKEQLRQNLICADLTSEDARKQLLIAPVLLDVCQRTKSRLKIEYPIDVSDRLKGSLDYYLQADNNLLVVEAKNADLTRGFTQLAVELIALDRWTTTTNPLLYGAVTTGDLWRFGAIDRASRQIIQDINTFPVPLALKELVQVLSGILLQTPIEA